MNDNIGKFKLDDRVRVLNDDMYPERNGSTGVVRDAADNGGSYPLYVKSDRSAEIWNMAAHELELIKPEKPAKSDHWLTRKCASKNLEV